MCTFVKSALLDPFRPAPLLVWNLSLCLYAYSRDLKKKELIIFWKIIFLMFYMAI